MKKVMVLAAAVSTLAVGAETKFWTGAVNTYLDHSTQNWQTEGGVSAALNAGDDAVIKASGTLTFSALISPGSVTIDNASSLTLDVNGYFNGLSADVGSIVKRGDGTLTMKPYWAKYEANQTHYNVCDFSIEAGVVQSGQENTYNTFGDSSRPFNLIVHNGGKLLFAHDRVTGQAWEDDTGHVAIGGEMNVIVEKGGTFEANASGQGVNPIGWLKLLGGTFRYGNGYNYNKWRMGVLEIRHGLQFSGDMPYILDYDSTRGGYQDIALCSGVSGEPVEIAVDDLSGGAGADVTINIGLVKPVSVHGEGFRKTGAGHLVLAKNTTATKAGIYPIYSPDHAIDGDIFVDEGILEFDGLQTLNPSFDREVRVTTNAELRIANAETTIRHLVQDNAGDMAITVDHGTFKVSGAHAYLGSLTLDHATFDYSGLTGISWDCGLLTFGRLFKVLSDTPKAFGTAGTYNMFSLSPTVNGGTEFNIGVTDGTQPWDVKMDIRLEDARNVSAGTSSPSGLIKTGPGTLCLNVNDYFSGDVDVREGTLMLNESCKTVLTGTSNGSQTLLGTFYEAYLPATGRKIDIEEGGTLWFNGSQILPYLNKFDVTPVNVTFNVKGGTLKFSAPKGSEYYGGVNVLPNLTIDDGSLDYGDGNSIYGLFRVAGTFKVTGTKPFAMPIRGSDGQFVGLNGSPFTVFDVDDVTKDAKVDAMFEVPFVNQGYPEADWKGKPVGFRKIGGGTMRVASKKIAKSFNGAVSVEAGTLQVDGDLSVASGVSVASDAYLAGTGIVQNVELVVGSGFRLASDVYDPLRVKGNLVLGETGTIIVDGDLGLQKSHVFCTVDGTIQGSLDGWTVLPERAGLSVRMSGNQLRISGGKGLVITVR